MNTDRVHELQEQAWSPQAEGKLEEAATAVGKALLLLEESGEANSPDAANLLNDLAEIESERQSFQEALALAKRAQSIEDQLGNGVACEGAAQICARTMGLIGEIFRMRGDFDCAEASLKEALRIVAAEFGEASEHVSDARNNLAVLYKACGRFDEGLRLYRQALDSVVNLHGEDGLASSVIYHNIGGILHCKGDFTAAEPPGRKAWEISRRLLVLRPEGLLKDRKSAAVDGFAFVISLEAVENRRVGDGVEQGPRIVFATKWRRICTTLPQSFALAVIWSRLRSSICERWRSRRNC
jgi:tetratricopeptide (TPR) repeat protein